MNVPKDPIILLSYVNTQLRNNFENLDELCKSLDIDLDWLNKTLNQIDYFYDNIQNQFI